MRQLTSEFLKAANKIIAKDKAETYSTTYNDIKRWKLNYDTVSTELQRQELKRAFTASGMNIDTVTDNEISLKCHELINNKWNQIINKFSEYPLEKIFKMAESNHNKMSHAFIELEFSVKLAKTQRDRIPQLNDLMKNIRG